MPHPPEDVDFAALVSGTFSDETVSTPFEMATAVPVSETETEADTITPNVRPRETKRSTQPRTEADGPPQRSDGWLQSLDAKLSHKVVGAPDMSPASREQYRHLAATLHNAQLSSHVKVVMIASAIAGEGKTLTAANLALTLSESYHRRVLLIDADLRRPTLQRLFGQDSNAVTEDFPPPNHEVLPFKQVTSRLSIVTIESPSATPMAELTSARMQQLVRRAREAFDWVVIDTPPVVLLPDATLLASMVDGVVLVVKAEGTSYDLVQRAIEALGKTKMLGVVLNSAKTPSLPHDYQHVALEQPAPPTGAE
jgi:capsular exopolysaccharide synthesis family protein